MIEALKISGGLTARKSPIGSTNHHWGMKVKKVSKGM
ncbi:hypothetical protein ACUXCC_003602 [Cytobacillus horneckiae]